MWSNNWNLYESAFLIEVRRKQLYLLFQFATLLLELSPLALHLSFFLFHLT